MVAELPETLAPPESVSISIADLRIREAAQIVADGDAHYIKWMPAIMGHGGGITYSEYWELTVAEHQAFVAYFEQIGMGNGDGS